MVESLDVASTKPLAVMVSNTFHNWIIQLDVNDTLEGRTVECVHDHSDTRILAIIGTHTIIPQTKGMNYPKSISNHHRALRSSLHNYVQTLLHHLLKMSIYIIIYLKLIGID